MTPYTKQKALRCIGFFEGFSAWVWQQAGKENKRACVFADAYDRYVEQLREAVMEEDMCKASTEFISEP